MTGLNAGGASRVSNVTYHPHGGINAWTAGNGVVTTIAADPSFLPRPQQITSSGLATGAYTYDGAGNIKAMGSDVFSYDSRSRLTSSTVYNLGVPYPLTYQYDQYGNLNPGAVNPANNRLTAGVYDGRGNLTAHGAQRYDYDGLSRQTALNGGYERYLYDGAGERFARLTSPSVGTKLFTIEPCRLLDTRSSPPAILAPRAVQLTGNCGVPSGATGVVGNLAAIPSASGGFLTAYPTGTNPATSTLNFNALQVRANNFQIAVSGNGQLSLSASTTVDAIVDVVGYFAHDAPTWTLTMRDEANRLATEYTVTPAGSISRVKNYLYLGNLLAATRNSAGQYTYYASDHLGTPRATTGALTESHKYQPFGTAITSSFGNQPLKFAAMERDVSSGNDFVHARYQSSLMGRFLSPDLLQGAANDPQSWNRYAYAKNNPLGYVDPTGLIATTVNACPPLQICSDEEITVSAADPDRDTIRAQRDILRDLLGPLGSGRLHDVFANAAQRNFQQGHVLIGAVDSLLAFLTPEDKDEALVFLLTAGRGPGLQKFANPKFAAHLEQQLMRDGAGSIVRSLRTLERRLAQHLEKLPTLKYKSSVEREIRNWRRDIETIKQFIKHRGIG